MCLICQFHSLQKKKTEISQIFFTATHMKPKKNKMKASTTTKATSWTTHPYKIYLNSKNVDSYKNGMGDTKTPTVISFFFFFPFRNINVLLEFSIRKEISSTLFSYFQNRTWKNIHSHKNRDSEPPSRTGNWGRTKSRSPPPLRTGIVDNLNKGTSETLTTKTGPRPPPPRTINNVKSLSL